MYSYGYTPFVITNFMSSSVIVGYNVLKYFCVCLNFDMSYLSLFLNDSTNFSKLSSGFINDNESKNFNLLKP